MGDSQKTPVRQLYEMLALDTFDTSNIPLHSSTPINPAVSSNSTDTRAALDNLANQNFEQQPNGAEFAENPPLFTCTYCPFILLDATSLEEHEKLHHQGELMDLPDNFMDFNASDSLSKQLFAGLSLPNSPQKNEPKEQSNHYSLGGFDGKSDSPNLSSGSQNVSAGSGRQFGRTLQQSQINEMQQSLSTSNSPQNTSGNASHNSSRGRHDQSACQSQYQSQAPMSYKDENSNESQLSFSSGKFTIQNVPHPQNNHSQPAASTDVKELDSKEPIPKGKKGGRNRKGQYKCEYCDKIFGYQQNLNQHRRMHTGDKYSCSICNKEFNFSQNLHQHMRVHSGKKEYKCSYCSKEFNDAANFHRHKRVIHGITNKGQGQETPKNVQNDQQSNVRDIDDDVKVNMPYSCSTCAMCFILESSLTKHLLHCTSSEASKNTGQTPTKTQNPQPQTSVGSSGKRKREPKIKVDNAKQKRAKKMLEPANGHPSNMYIPNTSHITQTTTAPVAIHSVSNFQQMHNDSSLGNMHHQHQAGSPYAMASNSSSTKDISPNHGYNQVSPPQASVTDQWASNPAVAGFIFVCPYCSFGVTNNMLFKEHLMQHKNCIELQYSKMLQSPSQYTFEGVIHSIMRSCIQVINDTNSPVNHNQSSQSQHVQSNSPNSSQASPMLPPNVPNNKRQLHNTPMEGFQGLISPTGSMHQWPACTNVEMQTTSQSNISPPVQSKSSMHHVPQQNLTTMNVHRPNVTQLPAPLRPPSVFGQISPLPGLNKKREFDDSGCEVEGDAMSASPWYYSTHMAFYQQGPAHMAHRRQSGQDTSGSSE